MSRATLAASLSEWTDIEAAEHALAVALGLMPASEMYSTKWVYFSNNPVGNELHTLLERLTVLGFLEKRDEPDFQYRVNRGFPATLGIEQAWQAGATDKQEPPGLTLVVLRCADLERSRQFYEALGLAFDSEQHHGGPSHYSTRLGNTVVELYPRGVPAAPSLRLGLGVGDVGQALAAVRELGDVVLEVDDRIPPVRALVRDPDGNKIELTPHDA